MFCFKHEGFREEDEWRIVDRQRFTVRGEGDGARLVELEKPKDRKFRRGKFVAFSAFLLRDGGRRPVVRVLKGPRNRVSVPQLRKFLRDNGFPDVEIVKSQIPYRG